MTGNSLIATVGGTSQAWRYNIAADTWSRRGDAPFTFGTGSCLAPLNATSNTIFYGMQGGGSRSYFVYVYANDTTAPTAGQVTDDGQYQNSATSLSASWTGWTDAGAIAEYSVSVGTTPGGSDTVVSTSLGLSTSWEFTGLTLVHGQTYYVTVRAKDGDENYSLYRSSNGITVDTAGPTVGTVVDEGAYGISTSTLSASWSGFGDALSGIAEYSYSIGTSAGDTSVRNWTNVGSNTSVSATGLTLNSGTEYFINIRAMDNAGNLSTVASNDGLTVDTAVPTVGMVSDQGTTTGNGTQLSASWSGFTDALSGIAEYSYSIGTSAGDVSIKGWTSVGTATSVMATGLTLTDLGNFFINIRAKDNAGNLSTVVSSDGIQYLADQEAPSAGTVIDDGQFTSSSTILSASWVGFMDNVSVTTYEYSVGTTAGGTQTKDWVCLGVCSARGASAALPPTSVQITGLNLNSGTQYFINLRAKDSGGNTSTVVSTDGITVDTAAPTGGTVTDQGSITGNGSQLSATLISFTDALSGIAEFSYSIGTSAGDITIKGWTSNGTSTNITAMGLNLVDQQTYYINVKAKDNVDNLSTVVSSDGIQYLADQEVPTAGTVSDEGQYTSSSTTLSASWTGFTDNSSVSAYEYSVGTAAGGTQAKEWTCLGVCNGRSAHIAEPPTTVLITGLTLTSGTQYFINVRAKDPGGNTSNVVSSDGITVDAVAPTGGMVADEGATTGNGSQLSATLSNFADALSGIAEYSYSIGTSAGDISIKGWTSNGISTNITATGLNLTDQQTYFITVKAKDNVGNTGTVVSSDGIKYIADANGPMVGTVMDEGSGTTSTRQLSASWTDFSDISGIAEYSYSIGTSVGDASIKTWTSAGTDTHVVVNGLTLAYGGTYYFNVRAKDIFGNLSAVAGSDGILVLTISGDMDQDGDLDLGDAKLANSFAVGKSIPTTAQILFADVAEPKDGKVTIEDANLILRCARGTIRGNPAYPWCPALTRKAAPVDVSTNTGGVP